MRGTGRAVTAEWYRLTHGPLVFGSALFLAAVAALRVVAARLAQESAYAAEVQRALSQCRAAPPAPGPGNAWPPFVDGWLAGLTVGTLLLLIASARSLAGDREAGLLRVARTRSVSRAGLVLGRALLGVGLVLGTLLVTGVGALLAALWLFRFGPIMETTHGWAAATGRHPELLRAVTATLPPLLATWTFGLLVSSCLGSGTGAVSAALATYLGFDLFKEVLGPGQYWIFAAFNPSFVDKSCLKQLSGIARGF